MSMLYTNILDNMDINRDVNPSAFRRNGPFSASCVLRSASQQERI